MPTANRIADHDIIEQFRRIEHATEKRVVAVHKIRFPEDTAPEAQVATG